MAARQKGWSAARLVKFRKTMAAKQAGTTSIPLSAIPDRPARSKAKSRASGGSGLSPKLQLLADVVRLLLDKKGE